MSIRIVQLGSPRVQGEGLRLGTVRRPPRGVPKAEFASRNYYDVWLPNLAPSAALVAEALSAHDDKQWAAFSRKYRAEMNQPDAAHLLDTFAALSHHTALSMGRYCEDEKRCHRSLLRYLRVGRCGWIEPYSTCHLSTGSSRLKNIFALSSRKIELLPMPNASSISMAINGTGTFAQRRMLTPNCREIEAHGWPGV